jgi:nicotinate phosphoribosyltransferase
MVYKLVSRTDDAGGFVSVAKAAKNKTSMGGRKYALRKLDDHGIATQEIVGIGRRPEDDGNDRSLLQQFMKNGELLPGWTGHEGVLRARQRHADTMAELPPVVNRLQRGEAAIPTIYEEY